MTRSHIGWLRAYNGYDANYPSSWSVPRCSKRIWHTNVTSVAEKGSFLPRHMDERHEELKGPKGWLLPSRRSLSWLIYLSDAQWDLTTNGGALRTFPQEYSVNNSSKSSSQTGDLQVGWLRRFNSTVQRVYLDSWYRSEATDDDYRCILYTLDANKRHYLTRSWRSEDTQGRAVAEFVSSFQTHDSAAEEPLLFLTRGNAHDFFLLEDRPSWDNDRDPHGSIVQDIVPYRGSLVVFDSVVLPHQVQVIHQGRRVALAGWFHERTQTLPSELL